MLGSHHSLYPSKHSLASASHHCCTKRFTLILASFAKIFVQCTVHRNNNAGMVAYGDMYAFLLIITCFSFNALLMSSIVIILSVTLCVSYSIVIMYIQLQQLFAGHNIETLGNSVSSVHMHSNRACTKVYKLVGYLIKTRVHNI